MREWDERVMAVSFVTERNEERIQMVEARIGIKLGAPKESRLTFQIGIKLISPTGREVD